MCVSSVVLLTPGSYIGAPGFSGQIQTLVEDITRNAVAFTVLELWETQAIVGRRSSRS